MFQASLHITAKYGDIRRAGFRVRGHLKNDFFATIHRKIQRGIRKFSEAGTKAIDKAKEKINSKKVTFDRAIKKLKSAEKRVNKAKGAFDRAKKKLRSWEKEVRKLCKTKRCGKSELHNPTNISLIIFIFFSLHWVHKQLGMEVMLP